MPSIEDTKSAIDKAITRLQQAVEGEKRYDFFDLIDEIFNNLPQSDEEGYKQQVRKIFSNSKGDKFSAKDEAVAKKIQEFIIRVLECPLDEPDNLDIAAALLKSIAWFVRQRYQGESRSAFFTFKQLQEVLKFFCANYIRSPQFEAAALSQVFVKHIVAVHFFSIPTIDVANSVNLRDVSAIAGIIVSNKPDKIESDSPQLSFFKQLATGMAARNPVFYRQFLVELNNLIVGCEADSAASKALFFESFLIDKVKQDLYIQQLLNKIKKTEAMVMQPPIDVSPIREGAATQSTDESLELLTQRLDSFFEKIADDIEKLDTDIAAQTTDYETLDKHLQNLRSLQTEHEALKKMLTPDADASEEDINGKLQKIKILCQTSIPDSAKERRCLHLSFMRKIPFVNSIIELIESVLSTNRTSALDKAGFFVIAKENFEAPGLTSYAALPVSGA